MKRFLIAFVLLLTLSGNLFGFGGFLRQSTAAVIVFGPFVNPADGVTLVVTLVSGLDNATTGIRLFKNGGAGAVRHATVTATTYDSFGYYLVTLDTTDTATLGRLKVTYADSATCRPVVETYQIVPANVFLSLFPITTATQLTVDASAAWATPVPGSYTAGQAGYILGNVGSVSDIASAVLVTPANKIASNASGQVSATIAAADFPRVFRKNQSFSNFTFKLVLSADHLTAATGKTVTATRSIDGAAFAACANSVTEISNGFYKINLAAADLNGSTVTIRFTATACDTREVTYILEN